MTRAVTKQPKDVRIGEFEDGQEAHVNMMDFRVGDETMSWFRDAYPWLSVSSPKEVIVYIPIPL